MKWRTAFELGELTASITQGNKEASRNIERLPQMTQEEIDYYLEGSIKYNKVLEIQRNTLDDLGRVEEPVIGNFRGMIDLETALIGEQKIAYEDIRYIKQYDFEKWFNLECPDDPFS